MQPARDREHELNLILLNHWKRLMLIRKTLSSAQTYMRHRRATWFARWNTQRCADKLNKLLVFLSARVQWDGRW